MSSPRVAYQGRPGAFSETAARKFFPAGCVPVGCAEFEDLFAAIDRGQAEYVVAPIENTLAGPIYACLDLLNESQLHIKAETTLRISHCLIGVPGAKLEEIREVESHPVALAQCAKFFAAHPNVLRKVGDDTAASVQRIVESGDHSRAAIAGLGAAELYGGSVLLAGIEDYPENFTRFALLSPTAANDPRATTTTLSMTLANQPGALWKALEPFASNNVDIRSIVSRPIKGKPWEYRFYLEVNASGEQLERSGLLDSLRKQTSGIRIFGSYKADLGGSSRDANLTGAVD